MSPFAVSLALAGVRSIALAALLGAAGCSPPRGRASIAIAPSSAAGQRASRERAAGEAPAAERGEATDERAAKDERAASEGAAAERAGERFLAAWLAARLPTGGALDEGPDRAMAITHTVQPEETIERIAESYLELTGLYLADDVARSIRDANHVRPGARLATGDALRIPYIVSAVPKSPAEGRLGWPDDKALRGLQVRGVVASGRGFPRLLDRMSAHGMNLVVLDVKDADGRITYPSRVPLAGAIGATSRAPIRYLARAIQMAHDRGIRVAMRIVCFEDELLARAREDLSVQSVRGRPLRIGWLDPASETVQQYLLDLAVEAMDAGADEIQMDYVRYPVSHIAYADFRLKERGLDKPRVIAGFVHRMHEQTAARGVPLSLDIFGIVAEGVRRDLENLGQDPALLAPECEALSPMLYPSHYPRGFMGFEEPGDHPELVQMGVQKLLALLRRELPGNATLVRPWIQGMPYHAPTFGPQYIAQQMGHARRAGAAGWMVWNPSQDFTDTWRAMAPSASAPSE